ncbi:MAG: type I glyceraldehyde-3-phosphate dehydrogenase [Myxococcota bacterium]|nr:type I glyceraldehyde-3-phosphate dehydrogenase [Myxococcota bacterium]
MKRIAINGFGRIGRGVFRALKSDNVQIVAINDLTAAETLAHLLKYDSVHGAFDADVRTEDGHLIVDGRKIVISAERDPAKLDWKNLEIDIVIESTGFFTERSKAAAHLEAGAKRVILSAPGKNVDATFCMGVNHEDFDADKHFVVSNASCTTNCLAPIVKLINENFGLEHGLMTTIHSVTNDQKILDLPHKDLRRARAAFGSMIPTTTGAARTVGLVLPEVVGKLDGMAVRVPTQNVSLVDFVARVSRDVTEEEVRNLFVSAAESGPFAPFIGASNEPLVSIDYNGNQNSATIDLAMTSVMADRMVKVIAWYDNESGYSKRVVDLVEYVAEKALS